MCTSCRKWPSRSQSRRYPSPLDKGNEGSGNEIEKMADWKEIDFSNRFTTLVIDSQTGESEFSITKLSRLLSTTTVVENYFVVDDFILHYL